MGNVLALYDRLRRGQRYAVRIYAKSKRRWVRLPGSHSPAEAALLAARCRRNRLPVSVQTIR